MRVGILYSWAIFPRLSDSSSLAAQRLLPPLLLYWRRPAGQFLVFPAVVRVCDVHARTTFTSAAKSTAPFSIGNCSLAALWHPAFHKNVQCGCHYRHADHDLLCHTFHGIFHAGIAFYCPITGVPIASPAAVVVAPAPACDRAPPANGHNWHALHSSCASFPQSLQPRLLFRQFLVITYVSRAKRAVAPASSFAEIPAGTVLHAQAPFASANIFVVLPTLDCQRLPT